MLRLQLLLKLLFNNYGEKNFTVASPDAIVSDNGTQFTDAEFQEFCHSDGSRHIAIAPYHPSSNDLAERVVLRVKDGLRKLKGGNIKDRLSQNLFQYRITPQITTGMPPLEWLIGCKLSLTPERFCDW